MLLDSDGLITDRFQSFQKCFFIHCTIYGHVVQQFCFDGVGAVLEIMKKLPYISWCLSIDKNKHG